jgi:hypothetical protein
VEAVILGIVAHVDDDGQLDVIQGGKSPRQPGPTHTA